MEQSAAASKQALDASKKALADEKVKSQGLEEENKALRGQVCDSPVVLGPNDAHGRACLN